MHGVIVRFVVQEDQQAAFESCMTTLMQETRTNEPGVVFYQLFRVPGDPSAFDMIEVYESAAAFDAHRETEHLQRGVAQFRPLLAANPEIRFVEGVPG